MELNSREKVLFKIHVKSYIEIMGCSEEEAIKLAEQKITNTRKLGKEMRKIGFTY
jgi:hypothetical protein